MIKIGLYCDAHFSLSSSIIQGKSNNMTGRLDNLVQSFEWINSLMESENVDYIVDLGDLTDSTKLSAEEITALSRCNLDDHYHIVGNHSISSSDGVYNSINMYDKVITSPTKLCDNVLMIPYSSSLVDLAEYSNPDTIILSHNDIKGINYGTSVSSVGYEINDIIQNCKLFINGHIHSSSWIVPDRICNLGILTGLNFSINNPQWDPSVGILTLNDDGSHELRIIANPYAIIFTKISANDSYELVNKLNEYDSSRTYAAQIRVPYNIVSEVKEILDSKSFIKYYRVLPQFGSSNTTKSKTSSIITKSNISDWDKLRNYINSKSSTKVDKSEILKLIDSLESE